jgi:hypothetical protein
MGSVVAAIIIVTVTGFLGLLVWAAQRGKPAIDPETGDMIFRHSGIFRWFTIVTAFGIPLGITILLLFNPPKNDGEIYAVFGLYVGFALLTLPLLWEAVRFMLVLSSEGITCQSPWRGTRFIPWQDIEEITFQSTNSMFIIHAEDGYVFRLLTLIPGLSQFLAKCEQHLPITALNPARDGYARLQRPFPRGDKPS